MSQPTAYPELNTLLDNFVGRIQTILGDNFLAAYLVGSFATGDWDEHGDVDFVVVMQEDLSAKEVQALNSMHSQIRAGVTYWHHHLEGSYFPKAIIRREDLAKTKLWYLDNGSRALERSTHCNELVVRWVTRERGITLAGLEPTALIDPIPVEAMRQEVRETMETWGAELLIEPHSLRGLWYQTFVVLSYCRMLHTLKTGRIESKLAGARWAQAQLSPTWHGLIERAWGERENQFDKVWEQADPDDFEATLLFIRYALHIARTADRASSEERTDVRSK
jgi:hypothetical protein